jgi:hypothetical protein
MPLDCFCGATWRTEFMPLNARPSRPPDLDHGSCQYHHFGHVSADLGRTQLQTR